MQRGRRQITDNPRNREKRRTVKKIGLPIVRFEDFYEQGHESDADRLFSIRQVDSPGTLSGRDRDFLRRRWFRPGTGVYVDTIAGDAGAEELSRLSYVFDEMVLKTVEEIGVQVREVDETCKDRMEEPPRSWNGRYSMGEDARLLKDEKFENFDSCLVWLYRVLRMQEFTTGHVPFEWSRSRCVLVNMLMVMERSVFDPDGGLVQRVWIALYQKLRVDFHTEIEPAMRMEVFSEDCRTMKDVSKMLLGARAYCKLATLTREEAGLFKTGVLSARERGLMY